MTQTSSARGKIPRWVFLLVGIFWAGVVLCAVGGGLAFWAFRNFDPLASTGIEDLPAEKVEQAAAIKLPPSARGLHSYYESFQDYAINVRFEMNAADLPVFLASTHVAQPLSSSSMPNNILPDIGRPWWQPHAAKRFLAGDGSVTVPNGPDYQSILIDTSDPNTYVVYVAAFET